MCIRDRDNEKLDIYYKGKLVLSDYEKARKKSEKNPYEDLAIAELEGCLLYTSR